MKVSSRIFFSYLIISAVCLYYPFDWILDTMRTRYLEGVEDPLVDQAHTLASLVEYEIETKPFDSAKWSEVFAKLQKRELSARIYQLVKKDVDTVVYVTDGEGIVLFHSADNTEVGKDYSAWRDVHYTLKGGYGARTSRAVADQEDSSVLYVAAPIRKNEEIAGVLSVGKPTTNISWFVENAKLKTLGIAALALCAAGLLGFFTSRWITRPIHLLTDYAKGIRDGRRQQFPALGNSEIGEMGQAFAEMQEALEGKRYVEQYVQNLTHEIKSPLSAIRGASELLAEPMEETQRRRFLANIARESRRMQAIVDRMLELSTLENRKELLRIESVSVQALVRNLLENLFVPLSQKQIEVKVQVPDPDIVLSGDFFLLHQALVNLVQNAIDFSEEGGAVSIDVVRRGSLVRFEVIDEGCGIPDYAREKVFDKFFSLQRPGSKEKSTGLGLNFVRQIALLHGGTIRLEKGEINGVRAVLEVSGGPVS